MGGGNGNKKFMQQQKNMKDAKAPAKSCLKDVKAKEAVMCKVCRQTYGTTV